jgi:hypothetical protein
MAIGALGHQHAPDGTQGEPGIRLVAAAEWVGRIRAAAADS